MDEVTLSDILEKICIEETAAIPEVSMPKLSFGHRRKMKRIFSTYEKTLRSRKKYRVGSIKRVIIVMVMIFLAMFTVAAGAAALRGFNRKVYPDYTELLTANAENCPKTIENVYCLSEIPEGYELYEESSDNWQISTSYINRSTNRYLMFEQNVKNGYRQIFNTERLDFEELEINGHYALYLSGNASENSFGSIVWDNGDYILKISGDFTKSELVCLVKSAKLENFKNTSSQNGHSNS